MTVTAHDVATAADEIQAHVLHTPTVPAPKIGEALGLTLFLKLENLQITGSFKDRGSCRKLQRLAGHKPTGGVIAASAGNHAQGVAYHARRLGLPATIVMPKTTPFSKVERTEHLGASVVLHGDSVAESYQHAQGIAAATGLVLVHPYDDPDIVAGQGTVAREMLADVPDLQTLLVPIGGGGLMAGMALWARHVRPDLELIGVQTELCPSMRARIRGEPMPPLRTHTLADGIAVKVPGEITGEILARLVDDVVLVREEDIEHAVQLLASQQKVVAEGAGAVTLAALLRSPARFAGRRVGAVVSGGNIDRRLLSTVLLSGLKRDGKIAKLKITIRDVPGVLAHVTEMIGASGADIIDIEHQRLFNHVASREAELDVVMETRGVAHVEAILEALRREGFTAQQL